MLQHPVRRYRRWTKDRNTSMLFPTLRARPANFLPAVEGVDIDAEFSSRDYHTTGLNDVDVASNVRHWNSNLASLYPAASILRPEP